MKRIKKLASLLLAMVMVLAMGTTVFAANSETEPNETPHTITISNSKQGHTYEAYQILRGDYFDGKLSNITWGDGVNGAALLAALQADDTLGADFGECTTAADVAGVLENYGDNSEKLDAFAELAAANKASVNGTSSGSTKTVEEKYAYNINVTGDGYYMVMDKAGTLDDVQGDAYSKYMLHVVGDMNVAAKSEAPSLTKKIVDGNDRVDYSQGFIGDQVEYELKSKVPEMTGYDSYTFIVHDKMADGLTFNEDVKVNIGTTELEYEVVKTGLTDGCTFEIVVKNLIDYKENSGDEIVVTYSATINEKAVIGNKGNNNDAHLEYSNNPYDDDVTGETPKDEVRTYVAGIQLEKVDGEGTKLTGAKFGITGFSEKVVLINQEVYRQSDNGTYYRLKDGTYTETAPDDTTSAKYEDVKTKYEKVTEITEDTVKTAISTEGWVDKNGILTFTGLGKGTYTITELIAPDGYNKLDSAITVVIDCSMPSTDPLSTNGETVWTATKDGAEITMDNTNFHFDFQVENKSGATLPSTGGIGTTIFYVIGGILVVAAGVLLVTKKRMKAE